jgi:hypothetical protein
LALLPSSGPLAAEFTPYFRSTAGQAAMSNAGLSLRGDRIEMNADIKVRAPTADTQIVPQLRSNITITRRVVMETRIDLPDWTESSDMSQATVDTRFSFRSVAPFIDELEGSVWRAPDGRSRQILKFGFRQTLRPAGLAPAMTLRAKATVESTTSAFSADDQRRFGFEAVLGGMLPQLGAAENSLKLKMERTAGRAPMSSSSLAYDHSWTFTPVSKLGVNLKLGREPSTLYRVAPSFGLHWRSQF